MIDWSRQIKAGWNQRKISNTIVAVIGCGGGGNILAHMLTMIGVHTIILCDYDFVEPSNLNRTIYYETDIHKAKVEALAEKLRLINPKTTVITYEALFEDIANQGTFNDCDYIFDCVDNVQSKEEINSYCIKKDKVLIHGAASDKIGEAYLIIPGKTPCLRCYPYSEEKRNKPQECNDFNASVCTTNFISASLMIDLFIAHLHKKNTFNRITYLQGQGIRYSTRNINPKCDTCQRRP